MDDTTTTRALDAACRPVGADWVRVTLYPEAGPAERWLLPRGVAAVLAADLTIVLNKQAVAS